MGVGKIRRVYLALHIAHAAEISGQNPTLLVEGFGWKHTQANTGVTLLKYF